MIEKSPAWANASPRRFATGKYHDGGSSYGNAAWMGKQKLVPFGAQNGGGLAMFSTEQWL